MLDQKDFNKLIAERVGNIISKTSKAPVIMKIKIVDGHEMMISCKESDDIEAGTARPGMLMDGLYESYRDLILKENRDEQDAFATTIMDIVTGMKHFMECPFVQQSDNITEMLQNPEKYIVPSVISTTDDLERAMEQNMCAMKVNSGTPEEIVVVFYLTKAISEQHSSILLSFTGDMAEKLFNGDIPKIFGTAISNVEKMISWRIRPMSETIVDLMQETNAMLQQDPSASQEEKNEYRQYLAEAVALTLDEMMTPEDRKVMALMDKTGRLSTGCMLNRIVLKKIAAQMGGTIYILPIDETFFAIIRGMETETDEHLQFVRDTIEDIHSTWSEDPRVYRVTSTEGKLELFE